MGSDARNNTEERRKLAREIAASARLVDRFGRPILEGCGYTVNMLQPPMYTVDEIVPVLDRADLPRGSFRVRMTAHMTLICSNGVPVDELALCAMSQDVMQKLGATAEAPPAEAPPANTQQPPAESPADPPPPPAEPPAGIHLVSPIEEPAPPAAPEEP